jgi:hypothetical protein
VAFPLPVFYQEFNKLFSLRLEVPVIDADEIIPVNDEGRNFFLL